MSYIVTRTDEEIDAVVNECTELENQGGSKFPGMSYEQGVKNALDWVVGNCDESPMDD